MLPKISYSRLRFYHFVDSNDQEMGTLEDVIIDPKSLVATHLILGGGFFEEYMESSGQIDDIDELAPLDIIDHIDNDYIVLNKKLEELETTDKDGQLPVNGFKYSQFVSLPLHRDGEKVDASMFDYIFDYDNSYAVIKHEGILPMAMAEQYYQKIELQLHIKYLEAKADHLELKLSDEEIMMKIKEQVDPKQMGKSRIVID